MNKENITKLMEKTDADMVYVKEISDKIISERTKDLDALMKDILTNVVQKDDPSDETIRRYFLELTNALYFIDAHCEYMGFYEDMSKTNAKLAYNKAFGESQFNATTSGTKKTVSEHTIEAENKSVNESITNLIYSRSYRIIKSKINAGYEMVRTLSKVLSASIEEKKLNSNVNYLPPKMKEDF